MLKRYASHFVFLPGYGYLKQYVVEVEEGYAVSVFPLTEEIENVEWFPGVIALLSETESCTFSKVHKIFQKGNTVLTEIPDAFRKGGIPSGIRPFLFYPFDFTTMLPADGIRHKQLQ